MVLWSIHKQGCAPLLLPLRSRRWIVQRDARRDGGSGEGDREIGAYMPNERSRKTRREKAATRIRRRRWRGGESAGRLLAE